MKSSGGSVRAGTATGPEVSVGSLSDDARRRGGVSVVSAKVSAKQGI